MTDDLVKLLEQLFDECGLNEDLGFLEDYNACVAVFAEKISKHYAARITALEAENKRLRDALKPFADEGGRYEPHEDDNNDTAWDSDFTVGDLRRAKAALEGE